MTMMHLSPRDLLDLVRCYEALLLTMETVIVHFSHPLWSFAPFEVAELTSSFLLFKFIWFFGLKMCLTYTDMSLDIILRVSVNSYQIQVQHSESTPVIFNLVNLS